MSCSRRDFFTSLIGAFLGILGWRARPVPALPTASLAVPSHSLLPVAQPEQLAYSTDVGGSVTTWVYDGADRVLSTTDSRPISCSVYDPEERVSPAPEQDNT